MIKMTRHMKKIYILTFIAALGLVSCEKFLDQNPDNRASIDTLEEIDYLLTSAYSEHSYATMTELMSDNVHDFHNTQFNKTNRFYDEVFAWKDVTESNNESPENVWSNYWETITTANIALEALDGSEEVYLYGYRPTEDDFDLLDIDEETFEKVAAEFESLMDEPL